MCQIQRCVLEIPRQKSQHPDPPEVQNSATKEITTPLKHKARHSMTSAPQAKRPREVEEGLQSLGSMRLAQLMYWFLREQDTSDR